MELMRYILLLLLAQPLYADNILIDPVDVIDVLSQDWNGDGSADRALLVSGEEDADLYLYLSRDDGGHRLAGIGRSIAWHGAMAGTLASLEQAPSSSAFFVHSQNDAIGRNRWHNKLTIAIRDNQGLVAGYTYESRDTLNLDYSFSCDLNLLNGKGFRNGKPFRTKGQRIAIADWSDDRLPAQCLE
jgi:hypothetical protein